MIDPTDLLHPSPALKHILLQLQGLHTAKNSVKAFEKLRNKKLDTINKIYTNNLPELVVRGEKPCNYNILASVSNMTITKP
jgi:hypothetical protein